MSVLFLTVFTFLSLFLHIFQTIFPCCLYRAIDKKVVWDGGGNWLMSWLGIGRLKTLSKVRPLRLKRQILSTLPRLLSLCYTSATLLSPTTASQKYNIGLTELNESEESTVWLVYCKTEVSEECRAESLLHRWRNLAKNIFLKFSYVFMWALVGALTCSKAVPFHAEPIFLEALCTRIWKQPDLSAQAPTLETVFWVETK